MPLASTSNTRKQKGKGGHRHLSCGRGEIATCPLLDAKPVGGSAGQRGRLNLLPLSFPGATLREEDVSSWSRERGPFLSRHGRESGVEKRKEGRFPPFYLSSKTEKKTSTFTEGKEGGKGVFFSSPSDVLRVRRLPRGALGEETPLFSRQ